ncbi:hypothetical protein [Allokutzneria sp. NRRL B-24872]|uniref:hypothetical protein n=1 Tax=Allokutzneria sp. NRRL B-24872 TaxID=1137961 RepID=UPI000A3CA359|nr:hypothetical protein [Allokutzneria sp. NRRL B-24872]
MASQSKAGLFDLRLIIALLFGVYGVVLTITGFAFTTAEEIQKAAGININLWAGLGMLVTSAIFVVWARTRPVVMPSEFADDADGAGEPGH